MSGIRAALAGLLLAAAPAAAQDNSTAPASAPPPAEGIGPRELSNFSLNGTVTREAQPQPAAQQPAAPARDPETRATAVQEQRRPAETRSAAADAPRPGQAERPAIDPLAARPSLPDAPPASAAATTAAAIPGPISTAPPIEAPAGFSPLPWIAALFLLGAGAVVYFGLQRRRQSYAGGGIESFFDAAPQPSQPARRPPPQPAPQPQTPPLARRPEPGPSPAAPAGTVTSSLRVAPPAAAPPGVVTSSLRPWIELELEPSQALLTDEHAAIAFDVTLFNSGSAPARDVAVEACLINAGQQQDVQLNEFYTNAGKVQDKIPAVAPMARITLKSAVRLPRTAVQEYEVEGRKLFMPMVAVTSRYRWSSGEGQSAASFLVGKAANDSAKLAPLRLDQGKRGWKGLAARRYEKGIRR